MKKFRLIVRIAFLVYIALTVLIGANNETLTTKGFYFLWSKGYFTFYDNMKTWGLIGFIIIVVQFVLENLQIMNLKSSLKDSELEVLQLKAQLFDKQKPKSNSSPKDADADTTKPMDTKKEN